MKTLINFEESDHYKWAVDYNETHGLKSVVFGSKVMSIEEAEVHCKEYKAATKTTIDREGRFSRLAKSMETNLKLEGIVGFTCELRPDAQPTFNLLQNMGVNVHILSGDNFEHNMMVVHQLNLIGKKNKQIILNFSDEESGRAQLKKALEAINQNMDGKTNSLQGDGDPITPSFKKSQTMKSSSKLKPKNLVLVISGKSVDVIKKCTYLYEHTLFTLEFSKSVIGFDMDGSQKASIISMFQKLQKTVMAVGDGFNDVNMVQTANVGFQMLNAEMGYQFGDIMVDNLITIANAMKRDCRNWNNNLHMSVHYFFVYSNTLIFVSLLYQIYCGASGSTLLNSYFICFTMFFMVPIAVSYIFVNEVYVESTRDRVPGLYSEKNYLTRRVDLRLMIFHMMPQSLIEAAVILILPIHALYYQVRTDGTLEYLPSLTIMVFALALLSFTFNMVIVSEHNRVLLAAIYAGVWGLLLIAIYFVLSINLLEKLYTVAIPSFFNSANSVIMLIAIALWIMCWNMFYWVTFGHRKYYPVYNMIRTAIETEDDFTIKNTLRCSPEHFLDLYKMTDSFTTTYRKSFKHNSVISTIISSLLVIDKEQLQKSSNWWLDFKAVNLAKNYAIYIDFRFSWILKRVGIASTVGLFIFLLLSYLIDPLVPYASAWVYVFIMLLTPALYFCTFIGQWSAMAHTYAILYQYLLMVTSILYTISVESTYSMLGTLILVFLSLHFTVSFKNYLLLAAISLIGFGLNFASNILTISLEQWEISRGHDLIYPLISLSFLYLAIAVATILQRRKSEVLIKEEFTTNANLDNNSAMAKDLLGMLLPKFILDRNDKYYEVTGAADCIEDQADDGVTILFCDIADFDEVVRKNENNIVFMLDKIFRKFDELCFMHGIQKIETVGKTYMAASGLKDVENSLSHELKATNQTLRMIMFAKDMMEHIKEYEGLALKIGIHFGKPVMGVIGYHKPQFSLIGDAVNTTSRHCTTGKKGRIMLSKEVWDIVGNLNIEVGGYMVDKVHEEMKGKGTVPVYQLFQRNNTLMIMLSKIVANPPQSITDPDALRLIELLKKHRVKVKNAQFKNMLGERFFMVVKDLKFKSMNTYKNFKSTVPSKMESKVAQDQGGREDRNEDNQARFGSPERMETELENLNMNTIEYTELQGEEENEKLKPSINLEFKSYQYDLVSKYNKNLKKHNYQNLRVFFILMSLEYILQIVLHATFKEELLEVKLRDSVSQSSYIAIGLLCFCLVCYLVIAIVPTFFYTKLGNQMYVVMMLLVPIALGIISILMEGMYRMYYSEMIALNFVLLYLVSTQSGVLSFMQSWNYFLYMLFLYLFFFIFQFVYYAYHSTVRPRSRASLVTYLVYFVLISFYLLVNNFIYLRSEINAFNNDNLGAKVMAKIEAFVDRLLPKHVRETAGALEAVGETAENVTLLFADIVGFTSYSSTRQPKEVVNMLSKLFTGFDMECNDLNLYKVYTIGDCYVVMSFLDKNDRRSPEQECISVVELGFKMIEKIAKVRKEINFDGLHMRIGIHTGKIIGGVIGTGIIRYDLYGKDVQIANKMESSGQQDKVHISEDTKKLLDSSLSTKYRYIKDDDVPIKALQTSVKTYFIEKVQD